MDIQILKRGTRRWKKIREIVGKEYANVYDRASQEAFYKTRDNRGWVKDPSGYYTTGWGLSLTTDEFAKIGLMVLNKGMYNGVRILSEEYIRRMLTEREETYGYLWWIYKKNSTVKVIRKEYSTGKYDSYCMNGVGGSASPLA